MEKAGWKYVFAEHDFVMRRNFETKIIFSFWNFVYFIGEIVHFDGIYLIDTLRDAL